MAEKITIRTTVSAPMAKVWECWEKPEHITQWAVGSPDWHTPRAENDLRTGGTFLTRMEAKDGSMGFDFGGTYSVVIPGKHIAYAMGDGREVTTDFEEKDGEVHITQTFDAESENPAEMQRQGWQGILDKFKAYVESR